jgi:hypothetical protein
MFPVLLPQCLTPRQVRLLAERGEGHHRSSEGDDHVCNNAGPTIVREIDPPYLYNKRAVRRKKRERAEAYAVLIQDEGLVPETTCPWPSWQSSLRVEQDVGHWGDGNSAAQEDSAFSEGELANRAAHVLHWLSLCLCILLLE